MSKTTLIYGGAGWDDSFLNFDQYKTIFCYDTMPNTPHYNPEHYGYKFQEKFVETLCDKFGEIVERHNNIYKFSSQGKDIFYNINFDFTKIENMPDGDIYICGYYPESADCSFWDQIRNRKVIINKDTYVSPFLRQVLKQNKCFCKYIKHDK